MDEKLAAAISAAPKNVLTDIVKLAQRLGREGTKGSWKEFLNVYDTQSGSSLSDPDKRSRDALVAFLQTFTGEDEQKFVANVFGSCSSRQVLLQAAKESSDDISPEQRMVHLTLQHPYFMSKYMFPTYEKDWLVSKPCEGSKTKSSSKMLAVDCEMVLCEDGTDGLVRVCVVDSDLQVKLDEMVNPDKAITDYRTEITGINPGDLDNVTCSLRKVQRRMKKLLSKGRTILVGHGLHNDLLALKIDHARVVDTSFIFKTEDGRAPSLRNLCRTILGYELREEGAPHNCLDDARTAMKIVMARMNGFDKVIPKIASEVKHVSKDEQAKLLLHKIPSSVPTEELRRIFPVNFTIQLKPLKRAEGKHYSVLAIFKNLSEAHEAFEKVDGVIDKDTAGRPQKLATLTSDKGKASTLYIRKMSPEGSSQDSQPKRPLEIDDHISSQKKQKTDRCDSYLEEIERLKQELRAKDEAIERLKQELKESVVKNPSAEQLIEIEKLKKEIEKSKKEIRAKDIEIVASDKIIDILKEKLKDKEESRKR